MSNKNPCKWRTPYYKPLMLLSDVMTAWCHSIRSPRSSPPPNEHAPYRVHTREDCPLARLFRTIPAEYPANAKVEAREHASADDSYDEQQVSARCGEEQLLGKGRAPATRMVYLQIASGRITTTSRTLFQSVLRCCKAFACASLLPINCAPALSLSSCLAHFLLRLTSA